MVWPAIIGAAGSLIGGILGQSSQSDARKAAEAHNNQQIELQRQFAQSGLQWRADDAMAAYKKTGIHPLAMLGVQGPTYSPTNFVGSGSSPMGDAIASAGQGVSRAMLASQSEATRKEALAPLMDLQLKRGSLENELLEVRIASEKARLAQSATPSIPTGAAPTINHPGVEPNIFPDVSVARTPRGGYVVLPGKKAQERMEEIFGLGAEWFGRNRAWLATPEARQWVKAFLPKPPSNQEWRYNIPTGEWLPSYINYPDRHLPDVDTARGVRRYLNYEAPNYLTR